MIARIVDHKLTMGRVKLVISTVVLVLVWTVLLPWVGECEGVRTMIERNESLGIDPTAMFYTELEHMQFREGRLRRIARP